MNETTQAVAAPAPAPAETTATEIQPTDSAAPAAAPAQQGSGMSMFVPMLLILGIFYFMMIRPQQRREKERRKMIEAIRTGTKVIFAGGLIGTIVEADEKTFIIAMESGATMRVLRSAVQSVVPEKEEAK